VVEEEAAADYANNSGVDPWPCIQHSQRSSSPVLIPIEAILSKKCMHSMEFYKNRGKSRHPHIRLNDLPQLPFSNSV
jgi:hypothetical protein